MALGDSAMANLRGVMMTEKGGRFRGLYITGAFIFFASADSGIGIGIALGIFTILFTGLAHLILKIVSVQDQINGGRASPVSQPMSQPRPWSHTRKRELSHYDQMIRKMESQSVRGLSADEAATQFASFFNGGLKSSVPFFANPHVQSILGIGAVSAVAQTVVGQNVMPASTESSASGAFWSGMPQTPSSSDVEACANPTCSTPVTVFDFRCFKCRNRFCSSCKGDKVTCPACS
jgi:hypothetical protein